MSSSSVPSIRSSVLRDFVNIIEEKGPSYVFIAQQVPMLLKYVANNPHRSAQLRQCLFIPMLIRTLDDIRDPESTALILTLLWEIVKDSRLYPMGIGKEHFVSLLGTLHHHADSARMALEVIVKLTEDFEGQVWALCALVHEWLVRVICLTSDVRQIELCVQIMRNICEGFPMAFLNDETFRSFEISARYLILLNYDEAIESKDDAGVSPIDSDEEYLLLNKFRTVSDEERLELLPQIFQSCPNFCSLVLKDYQGFLFEWARFFDRCTEESETTAKAIQVGLFGALQVIAGYGNGACLRIAFRILESICGQGNKRNIEQIVSSGTLDTLLRRVDLRAILALEAEMKKSRRDFVTIAHNPDDVFLAKKLINVLDRVLQLVPNAGRTGLPNDILPDLLRSTSFMLELEPYAKEPEWSGTKLASAIQAVKSRTHRLNNPSQY